eukprot:358597-Chlamydomonas_euryale.AAC.3
MVQGGAPHELEAVQNASASRCSQTKCNNAASPTAQSLIALTLTLTLHGGGGGGGGGGGVH